MRPCVHARSGTVHAGAESVRALMLQETEAAEIVSAGFDLVDGPSPHPYYSGGYVAVYEPAQGTADAVD